MNIFKKLITYFETKINERYAPNVEYVFEYPLSESTKTALIEISERLISQLGLDATVINKIVFGYDETDSERYGYYDHNIGEKTVFVNCATCTESYLIVHTIAHELYHAWQLLKTWGIVTTKSALDAIFNENDADEFGEKEICKLMPDYCECLAEDFPSNFN